jgi:serine/threonine-protein kinase
MLRIRALGGLSVERDGARVLGAAAQPRRMALLAMIARAGDRGISRDRLQSTLWPDADAEKGAHALKQALYALRRDADVGELVVGTRELRLDDEVVRTDVGEFGDLCRRKQFERAMELYTGPFLDGFRLPSVPEFEYWMEEERARVDRMLAAALERLFQAARDKPDPTAAVQWSRRLTALEPLKAQYTVGLMHALLSAGDRAGALQHARVYEELIAQELDLPPDKSVVELARQIRSGAIEPASPAPAVPSSPPATTPPPAATSSPAAAPPVPEPGIVAAATAVPSELSVVVVPFTSIQGDSDAGAIADGLTDELIFALGRQHDVRVSARQSADHFREGPADLSSLASRLGVSTVLEGSVRRAGEDVRVTARLIRARDGTMLWSERHDRSGLPVLDLQDEMARLIAEGAGRAMREAAGLPAAPTLRQRADELYSQGMRAWTPQGAGLGQGLDQFRQAIAIDPEHARAHAALAESYTQLAFYGFLPAQRAAKLVDAASREAMRLAPDIAESHLAEGTRLLWVEREFEAGTAALERALELDPAHVVAQARLAFVRLCHDGPGELERAAAQRAATLVGATGLSRVMYGQQLLAARRFDDAIDALHAAIDIEAPSFLAYHWLAIAYVQRGMGAEAVAAAVAEASLSDRHPWSLMSLVTACAVAGQIRRAETLLESLKARAATGYVQSSVLGLAHAALGDVETGMSLMERAVEEHDPSMMMLKAFPMFDVFRSHPRFRILLHASGWRDWNTAEFAVPKV